MKTRIKFKDLAKVLALATKEGEITLQDEKGEQYTIKHEQQIQPVNVAELRKYRVKMPNITSDELVESVHEMRSAGYAH